MVARPCQESPFSQGSQSPLAQGLRTTVFHRFCPVFEVLTVGGQVQSLLLFHSQTVPSVLSGDDSRGIRLPMLSLVTRASHWGAS